MNQYGNPVKPKFDGNYCLLEIWRDIESPLYVACNRETGNEELYFKSFYEDLRLWITMDANDKSIGLANDEAMNQIDEHCLFYLCDGD